MNCYRFFSYRSTFFPFSFQQEMDIDHFSLLTVMIQSEISLCRVYKRSGVDDGHGQSSSSTQASSGRRISSRTSVPPTGRHGSSPSSTPLSPTQLSPTQQLSSFHLLQGECSSASPPAPIMDQVVTVHTAPPLLPPPRPCTYAPAATTIRSTAAVAPQRAQGAAAIPSSTYSLLNMAAGAAPMAGSSRPIDELMSTPLVGPSQAYANLSAVTGSHFLPLMPAPPPPMPQMTPLGTLPMVPPPPSVTDKLSWDWNPVPDTTAQDYNASGFK